MCRLVRLLALGCAASTVAVSPAPAFELTGHVAIEARGFAGRGSDPRQDDAGVSIAIEPELYRALGREHAVLFAPFLRLDLGRGADAR